MDNKIKIIDLFAGTNAINLRIYTINTIIFINIFN
jgi:hypothetical protein